MTSRLISWMSAFARYCLIPRLHLWMRTELQCKDLSEFFFLKEIDTLDVTAAVNHFNTQSRGPDGIPQCFALAALPSIVTHLCDLFNASIKYSIFPSEWKRSLVLALNKIKTPGSPSDFRPISLLNFLSKALEYIVHQQSTLTLKHITF